jgi:DNA-binding LytR/AlgR family response regulator
MAEVVLRASEETRQLVEPLLARLARMIPGKGTVCLVEHGFPCPADGLAILFGPADVERLESLLHASASPGAQAAPSRSVEFLTGRRKDSFTILPLAQIRCFKADGDTITAELAGGVFEVDPRLYELETAYRSRGFIRVGKSVIVNVFWVSEIIPWFGGRLLLKIREAASRIEVSRSYVREFKQFLGMGGTK